MYFTDLDLKISGEDFRIDEDCDFQLGKAYLSGEFVEESAEHNEILTIHKVEVEVIANDASIIGLLDLTHIVTTFNDFHHIKMRCEHRILDEYDLEEEVWYGNWAETTLRRVW